MVSPGIGSTAGINRLYISGFLTWRPSTERRNADTAIVSLRLTGGSFRTVPRGRIIGRARWGGISGVLADRYATYAPSAQLQLHSLLIMDDPWVHETVDIAIAEPRLGIEELIDFIRRNSDVVTVNVGIYQDAESGMQVSRFCARLKPRLTVSEHNRNSRQSVTKRDSSLSWSARRSSRMRCGSPIPPWLPTYSVPSRYRLA